MDILDTFLRKQVFLSPGRRYNASLPGYVDVTRFAVRSLEEECRTHPCRFNRIAGYFRRGLPGKPVLLYCHGNAEDLTTSAVHLKLFHDLGYSVAAVDYPGYGLSEGEPDEAGCYANARALRRFLVAEGFAPKDIVVMGLSLGSGVAVRLAARQNVGGLILEAAFESGVAMAARMADLLGLGPAGAAAVSLLRSANPFPSVELIREVKVPVLSIHGTDDTLVPCEQGRALHAAAPLRYGFVEVPGAGHCDFIDRMGVTNYQRTIARYLGSL